MKTLDKHQFARLKRSSEVRDQLVILARERLAYQMGQDFSAAVLACLTGNGLDKFAVSQLPEGRSHWQEGIRDGVLHRLAFTASAFQRKSAPSGTE